VPNDKHLIRIIGEDVWVPLHKLWTYYAETPQDNSGPLGDWQKQAFDMVMDSTSNKKIFWVYSFQGDVGKSHLGRHFIHEMGALLIDGEATMNQIKDRISDYWAKANDATDEDDDCETLSKFKETPIIALDFSRNTYVKKDNAQADAIYRMLENIMSNFAYKKVTVKWETPPRIICFSNAMPNPHKLSPGVFEVYHLSSSSSSSSTTPNNAQLKFASKFKEQAMALQKQLKDMDDEERRENRKAAKRLRDGTLRDEEAIFREVLKPGNGSLKRKDVREALDNAGWKTMKSGVHAIHSEMNDKIKKYFGEHVIIEKGSAREVHYKGLIFA